MSLRVLLVAGFITGLILPVLASADQPSAGPQLPVADTPPPATIVIRPDAWKDLGVTRFGHNYEVYIPKETKSDNPDALRTFSAAGLPRNGAQQTPEGMACASDADCRVPLGCFNRADSGALPVRICAYPPTY